MELFRLFGSILINTDEADKSLAKTDKNAKSFGESLGNGIKTAGKFAAAIGTAAVSAATGMVKMATEASSTADNIDKMSQKIGISREAYQELAFAMSQSGAEVSDLQAGMKSLRSVMDDLGAQSSEPFIDDSKVQSTLAKYNNAVLDAEQAQKAYDAAVAKSGENSEEAEKALVKLQKAQNVVLDKEAQYNKALEGTSPKLSKAAVAMESLGVSVVNTSGNLRDDEEVMFEVLAALQKMTNETEKARYAALIFGKSGTELMPLLNGTADSLDKMRQEAHDLGLVMDDELVDGGVSLTDTLDKMKRSLGAVMTQLGARLMPIVEKAANFVISNMPKINKLIDSIAPIVEQAFDEILPVIMDMAEQVLPQLIDVVTSLLPPISHIFSALAPIVSELIQKLVPVVVKIIDKLLPPLVKILDSLTPVLDIVLQLLDPILLLLDALLDPLADLLSAIAPIITLALDLIKNILEPIMPLISGLAELLGKVLGGAVESVAGYFSGWAEVLRGVIEFLSGDFESGIQHAADGMVNMFSSALGAIDALFGTNFKKWYDETVTFFEGVGRDLYNALHPDAGEPTWSYEDALARTREFLGPAEDLPETNFDASSYYANHYKTPKLASGGIVYGRTLAVVGDNENVRANPEVVAPLSELEQLTGSQDILEEIRETNALLREMLAAAGGNIVMDGEKIATLVVNKINKMRYTRGAEVVYT